MRVLYPVPNEHVSSIRAAGKRIKFENMGSYSCIELLLLKNHWNKNMKYLPTMQRIQMVCANNECARPHLLSFVGSYVWLVPEHRYQLYCVQCSLIFFFFFSKITIIFLARRILATSQPLSIRTHTLNEQSNLCGMHEHKYSNYSFCNGQLVILQLCTFAGVLL